MVGMTGEVEAEPDGRLSPLGSSFLTAFVMGTGLLGAHLVLDAFLSRVGEETIRHLVPFALGG
jgi:hypothetical protein